MKGPASIKLLVLYKYPTCGVDNVIKVYISSLQAAKWGNAALIITPPKECPMNEILLIRSNLINFM